MGLNEKEGAVSVQKRRKHLINVLASCLTIGIEIAKLQKLYEINPKAIKVYNRSIKENTYALEHLSSIKHIEILENLYNSLIGPHNAVGYCVIGAIFNKKGAFYYDKEENFQEFLKINKEELEKEEQARKEQEEMRKVVQEATKNGKKIEFVSENGKMKPVIVEESDA